MTCPHCGWQPAPRAAYSDQLHFARRHQAYVHGAPPPSEADWQTELAVRLADWRRTSQWPWEAVE